MLFVNNEKEKNYFLEYLKEILPNKSINKKKIFLIKKETYDRTGNKKWSKKMDIIIEEIIDKGSTIENALYAAKIINETERDYISLAKTPEDGIAYILEKKGTDKTILTILLYVIIIPTIINVLNVFAAMYWSGLNAKITKSLIKVVEKRGGTLEEPAIFQDIYFFLYISIIYATISLIIFGIYNLLYYKYPKIFLKIFKFRNNEIFIKILYSINANRELGLNDLKSLEILKNTASNHIEKSVYSDLYYNRLEGKKETFEEIFIKHGFDIETSRYIGLGESIPDKFHEFLNIALTRLKSETEKITKRLLNYSKTYLLIALYVILLGPTLVEIYFLTATIPSKF